MRAFGYIEELALTKLAVAELEQEFSVVIKIKNRNLAQLTYSCMIATELGECRAYLQELEAA